MLDLCRICLYVIDESNCFSVFHKMSDNKTILDIMRECTSIQILYDDHLPKYVCAKCVEKLDLLYGFCKLIINSDLQLKEKLKTKIECLESTQAVVEKEENFTNDHCLSVEEIKIEVCPLNELPTDENNEVFLEQSDTNTIFKQLGTNTENVATAKSITNVRGARAISILLKSPGVPKNLEKLKTKAELLNSASRAVVDEENFTKDRCLVSNEEFKIKEYTSNVLSIDEDCKAESEQKMKLYECNECNRIFKTANSVKNHNLNHGIGTPFSCAFCKKTFPTKRALSIHIRMHTGDKPFTCDVCQKCFGSPSSLFLHKRIHNGVKKFNCDVCNRAFYYLSELETHMRQHTGEKPFMCEICSKTFGDKNYLIAHKGRHQEQLMPCPTCGKTYKGLSGLQQHMKRHNGLRPFSCDECGQKFTKGTSLNRHKLLHAGIKPFKCKICEKSFSQSSILFRHMRMHSGEKPFRCTLCLKEFAYKHHLQGHMKSHHKDALTTLDMSDGTQKETESTNLEAISIT